MRQLTKLLLLIGLIFWISKPAQADSTGRVSDVEVTHIFGEQIGLQATIESDLDKNQIYIIIQGEDNTFIVRDLVTPTSEREVYYTLDVTENPIRAFSKLKIWFEVDNKDGSSWTSEQTEYVYDDNRFDWQTLKTTEFSIYWYQEDTDLGQKISNIAYEGLERIHNQIDVPAPEGVRIYAYASAVDLQDTLMFAGSSASWVAGHADSDLGVIVVSLPPGPEQILEIKRQIPHELVHILLFKKLGSKYGAIPRWLNEGLATIAELFPNPDYQLLLDKAYERGGLIPILDLCNSFPVDAANFQLSYAESYAFTWYLLQTYGNDKIEGLIQAYTNGQNCDQGIQTVYGESLSNLEATWCLARFNENLFLITWIDSLPFMIVLGFVFLVPIGLMVLNFGKRGKTSIGRVAK
jgi:hypothetical protein